MKKFCFIVITLISFKTTNGQLPVYQTNFSIDRSFFKFSITGDIANRGYKISVCSRAVCHDSVLLSYKDGREFRLVVTALIQKLDTNAVKSVNYLDNIEELATSVIMNYEKILSLERGQMRLYDSIDRVNAAMDEMGKNLKKLEDDKKLLLQAASDPQKSDVVTFVREFIYNGTDMYELSIHTSARGGRVSLVKTLPGGDTAVFRLFAGDLSKNAFTLLFNNLAEQKIASFDNSKVSPGIEDLYMEYWADLVKTRTKKESGDSIKVLTDRLHIKDSLIQSIADVKEDAVVFKLNKKILASLREDRIKQGASRLKSQDSLARTNIASMPETFFLEIDSVAILVQNNTIYQIDIKSHFIDLDSNSIPVPIITNDSYGIPLRRLIKRGESLNFKLNDAKYNINYSDLFDISFTKDGPVSYMLRDSTYNFMPGESSSRNLIPLARKRLLDYISASAFIDLFGFSNTNPNKAIYTEVKANIPINHSIKVPWIHSYFLRNFNLELNLSADIGAFNRPDKTFNTIFDTAAFETVPGSVNVKKRNWLNSYDIMRANFLQISPSVNLLSWDFKKMNMFWDIDFGMHSFYSSVNISQNDGHDSVTSTVFSVSPELLTRFRINPQPSIGFDFVLSYLWNYRSYDRDIYEVTGRENTRTLLKSASRDESQNKYFRFEFNFYFNPKISKTSTERGGWYIKGLYLKNINNVNGYPQFMVGYSSDIKRLFRY